MNTPRVFRAHMPLLQCLIALLLLAGLVTPTGAVATGAVDAPPPPLPPPPLMPTRPPSGIPVQGGIDTEQVEAVPASAEALAAAGCQPGAHCLFLPSVEKPWNDPQNRQESLSLYKTMYLASANPSGSWSSGVAWPPTCTPGTTTQAFRDAVLLRVNYYRIMAGVHKLNPFLNQYNTQDQAAALMMSAQGDISNDPPSNWKCYSQAGHDGANSANLLPNYNGSDAVDQYMNDPGENSPVGHRRWILYPQTQFMGTGDVPAYTSYKSMNALTAWDDNVWNARPATRDAFVAWPPQGYVPYKVVYTLWSFAVADADFSRATVSLSSGGKSVPVTRYAPYPNSYGENSLVWKVGEWGAWPKPTADTRYQVSINQVLVGKQYKNYNYTVIIFDPGS